jgi:eukaryotic-like serine/threonine-protein kinase
LIAVAPDGRTALYCAQTVRGLEFRFLSLQGDHTSRSFGFVSGANCVGSFSPDGRWLAFESDDSGQTEIYVAPITNANDRRQVSGSGGFLPIWRGNHIYFANSKHRFLAVETKESAAGIDLGPPQELFGGVPLAGALVRQAITTTGAYMTHDGKRLLLPIPDANTAPPLSLVTNWPADLKK